MMDNECIIKLNSAIKWMMLASLVLQLAGFVSPGWYMENDMGDSSLTSATVMIAPWYAIYCTDYRCQFKAISDFTEKQESIKTILIGPLVETTLALLLCSIAVYGLWKKPSINSTQEQRRVLAYTTMLCCCLSCVFSITAAATLSKLSILNKRAKFPFALFLTGLGGVLAAFAFMASLIWRPWERHVMTSDISNLIHHEVLPHIRNPRSQTDNVHRMVETRPCDVYPMTSQVQQMDNQTTGEF